MPGLKSAAPVARVVLLPLLLSGCGGAPTKPKYVEEIAVFGYLYVGEAVSDSNAIVLTRTRPVDEYYDADEAAIRDAVVTLRADGAAAGGHAADGGAGALRQPRGRDPAAHDLSPQGADRRGDDHGQHDHPDRVRRAPRRRGSCRT